MDLKEINPAHTFTHPHDIARRNCLVDMLRGNPRHWVYADIGCGDQYITDDIQKLTQMAVHVVDSINTTSDSSRIFHSSVHQIDQGSINCALLLDVLEHTLTPHWLFDGCVNILANGGLLLITVPAYDILWSRHDDALGHVKRYDRESMEEFVASHGLDVLESFYFFTSLLPVRVFQIILDRFFKSTGPYSNYWPWPETHPFTRIMVMALSFDFKLNRFLGQAGLRPPGLSLCFLCRN